MDDHYHHPHHEPQSHRFAPYQRKSSKNRSKLLMRTTVDQEPWTQEEDETLRAAVYKHGGKKWKTIATVVDNRTPTQCNARWSELQNHGTAVKKPWSPAEDAQMLELVKTYGAGKWAVIASYLPGRNGKQCRERWHNQLNPAIKKSPWTPEEDAIILEMQRKHGNCWAKITEKLTGRTDNAVKNHWHSSMKGKLDALPLTSSSSSSQPSSKSTASTRTAMTATTRRRTSTKVGESRLRIRTSRRGASSHISRGSSSPDCVAAIAYEFDTSTAAYDDFASFALHDPVAHELFDLPRDLLEDVADPLGFMPMSSATDDSPMTVVGDGTCSQENDDYNSNNSNYSSNGSNYSSNSNNSAVKNELPVCKSPEYSSDFLPPPPDDDFMGILPMSPPYPTASATDGEHFHAALFGWDHYMPGLYHIEPQAVQPPPSLGQVEISVDDVVGLDALEELHTGPLALVCDADIDIDDDDSMSAPPRDVGLDASLNCLTADIDELVTHLCV